MPVRAQRPWQDMHGQVRLTWEAGRWQWLQEPSLCHGGPARTRQGQWQRELPLLSDLGAAPPQCGWGPPRKPQNTSASPSARCSGWSHCLTVHPSCSLKHGEFHVGEDLISWNWFWGCFRPQSLTPPSPPPPTTHTLSTPLLFNPKCTATRGKISQSVAELTQRERGPQMTVLLGSFFPIQCLSFLTYNMRRRDVGCGTTLNKAPQVGLLPPWSPAALPPSSCLSGWLAGQGQGPEPLCADSPVWLRPHDF